MSVRVTKLKRIVGVSAFLAVILLCAYLAIPTRRSGEELFKTLVMDPVPTSVIVLHTQDNETGFDGRLWLHFKISPADFDLVLASQDWKIDPNITDDIGNHVSEIEGWWNPLSLSGDIAQYSMLIKSDGDRERVKYMWVNAQRDEVYLLYRDDFTH